MNYTMVKIEFCNYALTFDDLECWLELNEEEPFTTIVVGTISVRKINRAMPNKIYAQGAQKHNNIH